MGVPVARKFLDLGWLVVTTRYVHDFKGDGVLWYIRRIPKHAQPHHGGKPQIRRSLKTRDSKVAAVAAAKMARADDVLWASLKADGEGTGRVTTPENRDAAKLLLVALDLPPAFSLQAASFSPGKIPQMPWTATSSADTGRPTWMSATAHLVTT